MENYKREEYEVIKSILTDTNTQIFQFLGHKNTIGRTAVAKKVLSLRKYQRETCESGKGIMPHFNFHTIRITDMKNRFNLQF